MITATRRIQFCAGHRVHKHESKCAHMHGHNYVAYFEAQLGDGLDSIGRVVDFSVIKKKMGDWIDIYWDHGFIFYAKDEAMRLLFQVGGIMDDQKSYSLPLNPTAENMADYLLTYICPMLFEGTGVTIISVVLEETENCKVKVSI